VDAHDLNTRLFITVREYAQLTESDPRTVRRGIEAGDIPAVRFSQTTRIPVPKIRKLLGLEPSASGPAVGSPNELERSREMSSVGPVQLDRPDRKVPVQPRSVDSPTGPVPARQDVAMTPENVRGQTENGRMGSDAAGATHDGRP
jgi:hypothetical protein